MGDFGRVFRMTVAVDEPAGKIVSSGIFMVIGEAEEELVRIKIPSYRLTICLDGYGVWGIGHKVEAGEIVPTKIDDPRVVWLGD